jgi:hypothetical protein
MVADELAQKEPVPRLPLQDILRLLPKRRHFIENKLGIAGK